MFYQDLFNCLLAWGRSRRWRRLFLLAFFPGLLFWLALGLVVYGSTITKNELASRYLELVQSDIETSMKEVEGKTEAGPAEEGGAGADSTHTEKTSLSDSNSDQASPSTTQQVLVPLRRIMQLGNSNERVVYLVARAMARQSRLSMAARMLRDIAPVRGGGFAPAHAFLADYAMASWKGTAAQAEVLLADLQTAERGGMRLSVQQLSNYALLLTKGGRRQEAINMALDHANEHPEMNLLVLQLEKQSGEQGADSRLALEGGRADFESKTKAGKATFDDVVLAVQLELQDGKIDRALELANYGFKLDKTSPDARRLFSNVLLAKHQAITEQRHEDELRAENLGTAPPPLDLHYLELACQIDSANPAAGPELAKVMFMGQNLKPEMKKALEQSLIDGSASGITHLILANKKLMEKDPHLALPELRLALRKMPYSPIVMNNLAYAILKYEPAKLAEAQELIERALAIPDVSLTDRAAMLDTLAEIRSAKGDDLGAIEMYEEAIKHDGSKLATRKKLAEIYEKVGMKELAKGQLAKIKQLSEQ